VNGPVETTLASSRIALYARVSTEDQADAETIQGQLDFLRRYSELHRHDLFDEYLDDGVSGMIPLAKRPEGARLLADAQAGRFGTVIFYRVSRLGRRLAIILEAYELLDAANVVVKSATEPIDTAEPIGRFIFQMLGAFAELDRETILDNTTRGRARGAKQGRWYGVVPTGYAVHDGKLVPNENEILPGLTEADLVRDIYRRIADGDSSIKVAGYISTLGLRRFKRYAKHDGREVIIEGRRAGRLSV
jgi:site-specific DNA recombinase